MASETIDVCPASELQPGQMRLVEWEDVEIGVFNCAGTLYAIEDRCSHDDGPLVEGDWEADDGMGRPVVVCPRHGARFDLRTGTPLTLPATEPVDTYAVTVEDGFVRIEVPG